MTEPPASVSSSSGPSSNGSSRRHAWTAPADRLKAFTDAVVAIAMTLLVLPVMEEVVSLNHEHLSTAALLGQLRSNMLAFLMSFGLIMTAWSTHHQLMSHVERVNNRLVWLTALWMLTIVWLPIPTVLTAAAETDWLLKLLYVGTLLLTNVLTWVTATYLLGNPELHDEPELIRSIRLTEAVQISLYVVALVIALAVPGGAGYLGLLVLALIGPIRGMLARRAGLQD